MRHIELIQVVLMIAFGVLFYCMIQSTNDRIYELEDRMTTACFLEVAGG